MDHIRNFSIIAHIDHGKSTLADRIIERTGGLSSREMEAQVLDSMDLERERGITIKAQTAALKYTARDGRVYDLNLIDTPGHVDFSYEVSRSLSACEGALLVVDASQGVEAQTVANCYTATELGVEVVPVLNKIDLPSAQPERVIQEIEDVIGIDAEDAIRCSAKTGEGVDDVLEAVIARIPPPKGDPEAPLKALIIDSWFDNYVGVVMLVRVVDGTLKPKDRIKLMATGRIAPDRAGRRLHAEVGRAREPLGRRRGLRHRRHQGPQGREGGRHGHARRAPGYRGAAGLQGDPAAGVRGPLPGRIEPVRGAARRARQAAAERLQPALRAGDLAGAGLRLPLRLPRPAAHGHRAGAPRARVRHGAHHHGADGGVPGGHARRHGDRDRQPVEAPRSLVDRGDPRAHHPRDDHHAAGVRRAR